MSLSKQTIIKPHRGRPFLDIGERPPCPRCGSRHIIKHGVCWDCVDCGRSFVEHRLDGPKIRLDRPPCPKCGSRHIQSFGYKWLCYDCDKSWYKDGVYNELGRKHKAEVTKKHNMMIKIEVFSHYCNGVPKCQCEYGCNETILNFLTIDHINNNGGAEITGNGMYFRIKKDNYPSKYRVLCYNCNMGRAHNDDICPHKTEPISFKKLKEVLI